MSRSVHKLFCTVSVVLLFFLFFAPAQAWFSQDKAEKGFHVAAVSLDSGLRTVVSVEFSQPVPESLLNLALPASIGPDVAGEWRWANPYTLKFLAQAPLPLDMQYILRLDAAFAQAGLQGPVEHILKTGSFAVTEFTVNELPSEAGPDLVELEGQISFNGAVEPEDLLPALHLKEANGTAVELHLQNSWSSSNHGFRSAPVRKTKTARTLTLGIAPTLNMAGKSLTLGQAWQQEVSVYLDPVLRALNVTGRTDLDQCALDLKFSAPVTAGALRQHLAVTPESGIQISVYGRTATVSGQFVPGQTYTVVFTQGLTAADGAVLDATQEATVRMPDLPASVDFTARGMFLPRQGQGLLGLSHVNTQGVEVTVSRVFLNNLNALFQDYGYSVFDQEGGTYLPYHLGSQIFQHTYAVSSKPNVKTEQTLSMSELVPDNRLGLYKLSLGLPGEYQTRTRWVLRTDIGLVAKKEQSSYVVWANSISKLTSLADLNVEVISTRNQVLGSARTNAQGLVRIPVQENDEYGSPAMIVARQGEDFSFLFLERFRVDTTGLDVSGVSVGAAGVRAYVYGKRDIYRPGETLDGVILVRDGRLGVPQDQPVTLEQRDPQGQFLRALKLFLTEGSAPFSLDIPDWALTGAYSLQILSGKEVIGSYSYQVEDFIPDRINVAISGTPEAVEPGASLPFEVSSRYLFGPPAADLVVTTKARLVAAKFQPRGFEAYAFGDPGRSFEPVSLLSSEARLDAFGQHGFTLSLPADLKPPLALEAEITARVREQGGRGVSAMSRVPVHVYSWYPGIKRPASMELTPGQVAQFDYVTVSPQGEKVPHPELVATLFQDRWQTVVRQTDSGFRYDSVRNPVEISTQRIAPAKGTGTFSVTPPEYGSYRLRLSDPTGGVASELEFYCGGWGYSPWAVQNPARLELVPDKPGYTTGEVASIQIRSPFKGKALVTVEGRDVSYLQTIELTGNTAQIKVPIRAEWQPNRHLSVTLIRQGDQIEPGSPGRAFGIIPLFVDSLSNKMPIQVTAPDEVRPGTDLHLKIQAEPRARLTVAVVDEGIMQLSGGVNPDPFSHFYAQRALEVDSFDNFGLLFPHISLAVPLAGGGDDGIASEFIRTAGIRRVKPVTFWSGLLTADERGQLTRSVALPDFQGALRIVVVGSKDKSFGTGTATTRVRTPLVVTPTVPRFLALGDEVQIPLTIRNDTPKTDNFTISANIEGPASFGPLPGPVSLAPGKETTVYLPLHCGHAEGTVLLSFTAAGGGETMTVREELDQRAPMPIQRIMASGLFKEETGVLDKAVPGTFVPGTVKRSVQLSTRPLVRFAGHLDHLLGYPHGCAEQTVSRAFPLLYFATLARELAPERFNVSSAAGLVQTAIRRLQTMQTSSGGYAVWAGDSSADPWVSAYVVHFLLEARLAGHTVPARMLAGGLDYLQSRANPKPDSSVATVEQAAYALYVLAMGGRPDLGGQDYLRATFAKQINSLARTLLAGAYFESGQQDVGYELLRLAPKIDDTRKESGGNLGSGLRDRALVALILERHVRDDPRLPDLMTRISADLGQGQWYSTQETSLAFMALGKYLEVDQDARPFDATLTWPEDRVALTQVTTWSKNNIPTAGQLGVRKTPADREVYYSVLTTGAPTAASHVPKANGLEVEQVFLSYNGQPLDLQQIHQGDLIVMQTRVRSTTGRLDNIIVQSLLPAGLEVENPRLATTEKLDWMDNTDLMEGHQDLRDDRVLVFTSLEKDTWAVRYSVLRAVTPGSFTLPPVQVEAMYVPYLRAVGPLGMIKVLTKTSSAHE